MNSIVFVSLILSPLFVLVFGSPYLSSRHYHIRYGHALVRFWYRYHLIFFLSSMIFLFPVIVVGTVVFSLYVNSLNSSVLFPFVFALFFVFVILYSNRQALRITFEMIHLTGSLNTERNPVTRRIFRRFGFCRGFKIIRLYLYISVISTVLLFYTIIPFPIIVPTLLSGYAWLTFMDFLNDWVAIHSWYYLSHQVDGIAFHGILPIPFVHIPLRVKIRKLLTWKGIVEDFKRDVGLV